MSPGTVEMGPAHIDLRGSAWSGWRGGWGAQRLLIGTAGRWRCVDEGRTVGRWQGLEPALAELWARRRYRDDRPFVIGWLSYEACALLAGGLPVHSWHDGLPEGVLLIEPDCCRMPASRGGGPGCDARMSVSLDDNVFRRAVDDVTAHIAAGDVYQVNVTRRFRVSRWDGGLGPLEAALDRSNLPEYACRMELRDLEGQPFEMVCGSMEMLLRRRELRLETRPIKGTRPRGASAVEDQALAAELEVDTKELSELAMVVDLERNDLGTVAEVGSVEVLDPGRVVSYAGVHHRVARVGARLADGVPWWRVMAAIAPGGSVTGCPKHAAMGVIRRLEPTRRGPFTGVLGVVAANGDMELALPIRTAWRWGRVFEMAAGCGIVWGSDPDREELESRLKLAHWLELVSGVPEVAW